MISKKYHVPALLPPISYLYPHTREREIRIQIEREREIIFPRCTPVTFTSLYLRACSLCWEHFALRCEHGSHTHFLQSSAQGSFYRETSLIIRSKFLTTFPIIVSSGVICFCPWHLSPPETLSIYLCFLVSLGRKLCGAGTLLCSLLSPHSSAVLIS